MNRKLILLNVVLVLVVGFAGVQLRKQWKAAKQRESARLRVPMKTMPAPPYEALTPQPAVVPAGYEQIAKKMLFDRSRDSAVVVELPPPPPPPPPMPALPGYHGVMNFGTDGPIALLSTGNSGPQAIRIKGKIGQFTLLDVNTEVITFEWNGETVRRNTSDLPKSSNGSGQSQEVATRTEGPAIPAPAARAALVGPGEETRDGAKACNVNDGNSAGAVVGGYRKVTFTTPFGQSCTWEPAR